ncbi:hypothetical protein AZI87_11965 [Bdellovibrio bacteriovorus]|uniref:Uncharacterized protein n=1 Tax=Bdellovibrio bacteriovorus TaxID=959 RepID=A0A162G8B1_BDEBC|nr:hypothetical protein [Bdellovibrio bacteriovorus]KYG65264.1 hypothetical protein AZI87_11965 [Bdellovibrio bacteriovorus]
MESVRAVIGDQNLVSAFWMVIGSVVLSNIGLLVGAAVSHFRKIQKMRKDINEAHRLIRILRNQNNDSNEGE